MISALSLSSSCERENDDCHKQIKFANNSDKDVYVQFDGSYPDTTYFGHGPSPANEPGLHKVVANTTSNTVLQDRSCLEYVIRGERVPSDTLMIFVFDALVIDTNDWADVVHFYLVEKRYDLSLGDLVGMNWTINYP